MAYATVLPPDTQNEIAEFIEERYVGHATSMQVVDAIEQEIQQAGRQSDPGCCPAGHAI